MKSIVSMTKLNESTKELSGKWCECDLCLCNPIARPSYCFVCVVAPFLGTHARCCWWFVAEKGKMKMHSIWDECATTDSVQQCPGGFSRSNREHATICQWHMSSCRYIPYEHAVINQRDIEEQKSTRNFSAFGFSKKFHPIFLYQSCDSFDFIHQIVSRHHWFDLKFCSTLSSRLCCISYRRMLQTLLTDWRNNFICVKMRSFDYTPEITQAADSLLVSLFFSVAYQIWWLTVNLHRLCVHVQCERSEFRFFLFTPKWPHSTAKDAGTSDCRQNGVAGMKRKSLTLGRRSCNWEINL